MIGFYSAIARRLHGLRAVLWVLVALALGGFATALALTSGTAYLLLALCLLLWSICLLLIVHTFVHPLPESREGDGLLVRVRVWSARVGRWLLAWVMTGLAVAVLIVSARAAALALGAGTG